MDQACEDNELVAGLGRSEDADDVRMTQGRSGDARHDVTDTLVDPSDVSGRMGSDDSGNHGNTLVYKLSDSERKDVELVGLLQTQSYDVTEGDWTQLQSWLAENPPESTLKSGRCKSMIVSRSLEMILHEVLRERRRPDGEKPEYGSPGCEESETPALTPLAQCSQNCQAIAGGWRIEIRTDVNLIWSNICNSIFSPNQSPVNQSISGEHIQHWPSIGSMPHAARGTFKQACLKVECVKEPSEHFGISVNSPDHTDVGTVRALEGAIRGAGVTDMLTYLAAGARDVLTHLADGQLDSADRDMQTALEPVLYHSVYELAR